ncbi:zinc finger protein AEBP2-like [Babylonia areolata]|uniref:zinc finger protein AEBP2-like n=1 Tax=Babylonia areolata TaxID=304850 RepID=UPI003FCEF66B
MGSAECILWLCYSQESGRLIGTGDSTELAPCKLELACSGKMGLGCGLDGGCSCPSSTTQEVCASLSPPDLVPEVPNILGKRERRDSNGVVDGRGIPDTPISPLPCLPLPFPKIPSSPGTSPQSPILGNGGSNKTFTTPLSSPLSSVSSPTGTVASLFGGSQGSRSLQQATLLKGSTINNNNNGSINSSISKNASWSNHASSSSSQTTPVANGSTSSSKAATPVEDTDIVCQWKGCGSVVSPADLLDHLRIQHVDTQKDGEKFVCEWEKCKVAGKPSCSMSWLERHVVGHGGQKPYACIVPDCGQRFPTGAALHRHVLRHLPPEGQSCNGRSNRSRGEDSSTRVVRRKSKLKRRRPQCVRNGDFFDTGIMDQLKQQLWDFTAKTQNNPTSSALNITFQGAVKARRLDDKGKESVLFQWTPEDVVDETWMASSQVDSNRQLTLPLSHLPSASVTSIHPNLYRRHRFRKHRRK